MGWFQGFLASIGAKLMEILFTRIYKYLEAQKKQEEQKKTDEANLKEYTDAIQSGASKEEIAKKAEDLLNGR